MSAIIPTLIPCAFKTRKATSLPGPGPLIKTSIALILNARALLIAFSTVIVAAYGVDFLEPEKPASPAVDQHNTLHCSSVTLTNVVLKVAVTYKRPFCTIRVLFFFATLVFVCLILAMT